MWRLGRCQRRMNTVCLCCRRFCVHLTCRALYSSFVSRIRTRRRSGTVGEASLLSRGVCCSVPCGRGMRLTRRGLALTPSFLVRFLRPGGCIVKIARNRSGRFRVRHPCPGHCFLGPLCQSAHVIELNHLCALVGLNVKGTNIWNY